MVEILDPKPGQSVYDPCCGSGGMLILSYKHVRDKYGPEEANKLFPYGQEANLTTYGLCKMNLYIHGIRDANIELGDTLLYPKFVEDNYIKKFDIVIANPPWNQDGYDEDQLKKGDFWNERFKFGFASKQSADWIWIQHMIDSAKNDGKIGIILDNGCLFRGGKEFKIRKKIIDSDLIECIILLPEKLFYNTGAPGAIIIFNKNKRKERQNKILFINGSEEFEQHPNIRRLNYLNEQNIENISNIYHQFKERKGFSKIISIDKIKENDYNLNVSLYVIPDIKFDHIEINEEWNELEKLENELKNLNLKIKNYLDAIL